MALTACGTTQSATPAAPGRLESAEYQDKFAGYGQVFMLNTSGKPCLLRGYPKITMEFAGGQPMESHVVDDKQPGAAETVLAPNEWAGFSMSWKTGVDCQTPLLLNVTPPGNGTTHCMPATIARCTFRAGGRENRPTDSARGSDVAPFAL